MELQSYSVSRVTMMDLARLNAPATLYVLQGYGCKLQPLRKDATIYDRPKEAVVYSSSPLTISEVPL